MRTTKPARRITQFAKVEYQPLNQSVELSADEVFVTILYKMYYLFFCARVPDFFFFDTTRQIIQLRPPRQGGGVSDTVPFPKRHTVLYIKPNTGDGRELSPPSDIQNRTQETVESRPPVLYKAEHKGR